MYVCIQRSAPKVVLMEEFALSQMCVDVKQDGQDIIAQRVSIM